MAVEHDSDSALADAVRRAGSQSAFARLINRKQSTVFSWLSRNHPLPAELVLTVEHATGVSRHDLRPDIYPEPHATVIAVANAQIACGSSSISHSGDA
jgi:DNA-binding transcriptional regulator YdaS (Cro superfamily)